MLKSVRANVAYLSHMEKHGHLLLHAKQILETVKEVDRLVVNHNMLYKDIVAFTGLSDSKLLRFHKFAKYPCLQVRKGGRVG